LLPQRGPPGPAGRAPLAVVPARRALRPRGGPGSPAEDAAVRGRGRQAARRGAQHAPHREDGAGRAVQPAAPAPVVAAPARPRGLGAHGPRRAARPGLGLVLMARPPTRGTPRRVQGYLRPRRDVVLLGSLAAAGALVAGVLVAHRAQARAALSPGRL